MRTFPARPRLRAVLLQAATLAGFGLLALSAPFARPAPPRAIDTEPSAPVRHDTPPKQVLERTAAIRGELARPRAQPWAGAYYEGDGLGTNIRLLVSPRAGAAATWYGCMGLYGANEGAIEPASDGSLRLSWRLDNTRDFGGFPDRVLPVAWGDRHYLVPPSRLQDFVNAINQGYEPRPHAFGMFLLEEGDEARPVRGLPALPPEYAERIRTAAVHARVASAVLASSRNAPGTSYCRKVWRLKLDVEGAGPLRTGDELQGKGGAEGQSLTIIALEARHPVGTVTVFENDCSKPSAAPDGRWRFTTGAYDPTRANKAIAQASAADAPTR